MKRKIISVCDKCKTAKIDGILYEEGEYNPENYNLSHGPLSAECFANSPYAQGMDSKSIEKVKKTFILHRCKDGTEIKKQFLHNKILFAWE